jgi:Domain of unknown function (DUF1839)
MNAISGQRGVIGFDTTTYQNHWLHTDVSDWPETNCYVDVWIELLHVLRLDPIAALGFTIRTDLESDQWTFYKYRHHDLEQLFGLVVIELNPWTTVIDQVAAEVAAGRPVLVEVDAWYLPDTTGTSYQSKHVKTTIAVLEIDCETERLVYAHNRSVHITSADDFRGVFALDTAPVLPPYIESVRLDRQSIPTPDAACRYATDALRDHVRFAPAVNPFVRYQAKFERDLARMAGRGMEFFHDYAFSSYRQFGSAFFLAAAHLEWLRDRGSDLDGAKLSAAAESFRSISSTARALQMRSARTAVTGKIVDASSTLQSLADNYDGGLSALRIATEVN